MAVRQEAAAVAVTKPETKKRMRAYRRLTGLEPRSVEQPWVTAPMSPALHALTAAALALPGLLLSPAYAAEEEASFQYGHYQEGKRQLFGVKSRFKPIEVESLQGSAKIKLADRVKFAFNYVQDTWGGATPIATAPLAFEGNRESGVIAGATPFLQNSNVYFDRRFNPLRQNPLTGALSKDKRLVHTLSSASPETRKQGDFKLGYEWDEAALDIGGGISLENDYESRFGNLGGRWDFNQKLTSVDMGLSYTHSDTRAIIDHDAAPYIYDTTLGRTSYNNTNSSRIDLLSGGKQVLRGERQDWATHLGLTRILNKSALLEAGVGYTRSTGYMANPYKAVEFAFIDPKQIPGPFGELTGTAIGLLEQRPEVRNQWTGNMRYVQHIDALDAAVHFDYRLYHDDWGITAHTFEADWVQPVGNGWTITPRVRYYSQDAADFYRPYVISKQPFESNAVDAQGREIFVEADNPNNGKVYFRDENFNLVDAKGNIVDEIQINPINKIVPFDRKKLPAHYSSDHRLSGYGALSGGVTISKQFAKGVNLEAGAEYYTHAGSLKLGGGGEGAYADFNYYMVNAALKVDLSALSFAGDGHHGSEHDGGHSGHSGHAPAGVMFDHMLSQSGDFMVGYRYMYGNQAGNTLQGSHAVSDRQIVNNGCGNSRECFLTSKGMDMHMHMLDLMYAPTDWLNLMLMPQFVDMNMSMRALKGAPPASTPAEAVAIPHHTMHEHTTGGIGDTGLYALVKLFDIPGHHVHTALGFSAPTGEVGVKFRDTHGLKGGFMHYDMQLGSGTWDFKPSITYTGQQGRWSWGAQLSGTKRLEDKNKSGFVLGDIFQSTAWGGYELFDWLSASVRGVYTVKGSVKGKFNGPFTKLGPMDYANNYGGRYWDVGFGLNAFVPRGDLAGNRLSFEWLQPVDDDVNGYQLPREGALSATWSYAF